MKIRLAALTGCLEILGLIASGTAIAETPPSSQLSTEVGFGYEAQTSPLLRISPQGELLSIDGMQQLGNSHLRVGVQGFSNWQLDKKWGLSLAGDASQKRSPGASMLNFGTISVQPSVHMALDSGSLSAGPTWQNIDVGGKSFREVRSAQLNWTSPGTDGSLWALIADTGTNRHTGDLADLDASTASIVLQRHLTKPFAGFEALDVAAYLSRERNERGFSELSFRSLMVSASLQWEWAGTLWTAGTTLQKVQFADTVLAEDPLRVDQSVGLEFSAEHALSSRHTLRVEYSNVRNVSTIPMYDNDYHQFAVKLRSSW